ncbi:MAG: ribonuclease HI family protein [Acidobacteria bacterium]|nr:ribonuclease HI family protein [Acidobacteriota bacterium]
MITANVDGGARGNPGSAGYGVIVKDETGTVLAELYEGIGVNTNNVAEYRGVLAALDWAAAHGHSRLHIKSDSLLVVQQMLGTFRVKHAGLLPLYRQARHLVAKVGNVTFEHVRRELNTEADRLSNLGMDQNARP